MTFQLGAITGLTDPVTQSDNGDEWSIKSQLFLPSSSSALAVRQQALGYLRNPDEKYIPAVSSVDANRTGFYRVTAMQVDTQPDVASGMLPMTAKLERFPGYSYPMIEMLLSGANRTGSVGSPTPWHAVPSTWTGYDIGSGVHGLFVRQGSTHGTADIWFFRDALFNGPLLAVQCGCAPANFYDCAVTFTSSGNRIIGRQFMSDPTSWVLANTLVEVQPDQTGSNLFKIRFHDGTAWSASTSFKITSDNGATFWGGAGGVRSVTVLRNGPERISIRLAVPMNGVFNSGAAYVDLTLRRGSRYIEGSIHSTNSSRWGLRFAAATATTVVDGTGGAHKTNAAISDGHGGAGHKLVYGSGSGVGYDVVNGQIALVVAGTQCDFVLGSDIQTPGADPDRATDIRDQYYAAVSEMQWVVAQ